MHFERSDNTVNHQLATLQLAYIGFYAFAKVPRNRLEIELG